MDVDLPEADAAVGLQSLGAMAPHQHPVLTGAEAIL